MPSINDIRKANPSVYGGLTDYEVVDRLSQLTGRHPDAIGYDLGVSPRNAPGFTTALKSSVGSMVQGVGQLGADFIPGVGADNAVERYGREVTQRNPVTIMEGSGNALENIGTNLMEQPMNTIGQIAGGAVGFMGPGGVAKVGLNAYRGLRGIQALEAASGVRKAAGMAGEAAYYGLPSYGQIRDVQESTGDNSFEAKLKAGLGSLAVGGIETFAGPEAALSRGIKNVGGAGKTFVRTGLKQGAFEAGEEMLQQPIESWASGTPVDMNQVLAGGVAGFVGGMPMGMAMHPFMKKAETANSLLNKEQVNLTDTEQPRTLTSTAQERINAGRNLPQYGLETQDVLMVTPTGDVLTTQEQVDAWNKFGKVLKPVETTPVVETPALTIEGAKTRKAVKAFLNQEFDAGNITQEQHADATNVVDMAKSQPLIKIKTSVTGIIAPQEEAAAEETTGKQESTTPVTPVKIGTGNQLHLAETESTAHEGNLTELKLKAPVGITREAGAEDVQKFQAETAAQLAQAVTSKQMEAIKATRGVRNADDSGWEIDPNTGEEMVPMSNAVMASMNATTRQAVSKNAQTGLKKLYKRAADLGLTPEAADRILGIHGEQAIDTGSISEAQAAQAGLTYRREQGAPISNMPESEDLDTTVENYQPEMMQPADVGFEAPTEAAQAQDVELPAEVETAEEEAAPTEAGYEQDFDLSAQDYENAKDVWDVLREEYAREGVDVPAWEDIPASAFEKFAASAKYHLEHPAGQTSVAAMSKAQEEAAYGKPTTRTNEPVVAGTKKQAEGANVRVSEKPKPAARRKTRRGETEQTVKPSQAERPENPANADSIRASLKRLFFSPAKFDSLVTIVQKTNELPIRAIRAARLTADDTTVQGFVWQGHVYMIADNIAAGDEMAVLMHELGVHIGVMNALDMNTIKDLAKQIVEWNRTDNGTVEFKAARSAMARLTSYVKGLKEDGETITDELYAEEVVAYFVEEAVKLGVNPAAAEEAKVGTIQSWMKRLVDVYRAALRAIGFGRFEDLTAQNIIDFSYGVANLELNEPSEVRAAAKEVTFSKAAISKAVESVGNYTEEFVDSLPPGVGENARYAADAVGNMTKKGLWYSMFTNDLIDIAKKVIPTAQRWYDQINAKAVDQIKREAEVDAIANESDKLSRDQFVRTWDLIKRMTGNQKWAYQPTWRDTVAIDQDYAQEYNELSDEEQALIDRVFKHGHETIKETQAILDQILNDEFQAKLDKAKTDEEKATILKQEKKFKDMFGRKLTELQGPYAPMRRVGSHVVVAKSQALMDAVDVKDNKLIEKLREDENHYKVMFFDSMAEAKREQRRLEGKYASVRASEKDNFTNSAQMLPFEAFDQIRKMASEKEGDIAGKLNNLITELYLTSLAETSSRKSELRRGGKGIAGLNPDTMYKAFVSKGRASAHYIATLKNSKQVAESFAQMRQEARANTDMVIFNELAQRYANSVKYDPMPIAGKIMAFNTIWSLLTKPAYYLYNATQPALMTLPYFSQRFAYGKATAAMTQAYKDIAAAKGFISLKDATLHVESMPEDVRRALRDLLDSGKLDITITQDLGSRVSAGQGKLSRGMALVDKTLRTAAQKVETTNRLVTAIAAYRLAMGTPNMTHEGAVKYAAKAIDQTQGDYSNFNAPRLFNQTSFQRVITQFRKFQLIQVSFLVRMFKDATVGATKAERIAARRALGFVLAHHAVLAGALGLPAANIIAYAFSATGGDDEPKDLELELRKALGNDFMADLVTRGVPAAFLNVNVSNNVGMGQAFSLLPFTDIDFSSRDGYNAVLAGSMGPFIGGVGPQMWAAMGSFGRGDYYKGLEGVMPSGARTALKAFREGYEGVTNTRGDELVSPDEIALGETFAKLLGFKTNTDATRQLVRDKTYEFEKFFKDRTSELKNDYTKAYRNGDSDAMATIRDEWNEMNAAKRSYGFTVQPLSKLLQAPREKAKRERETVGGVQVKKSNVQFVESMVEEE